MKRLGRGHLHAYRLILLGAIIVTGLSWACTTPLAEAREQLAGTTNIAGQLGELAMLDGLKELDVSFCTITDEDLSALFGNGSDPLPGLLRLSANGNPGITSTTPINTFSVTRTMQHLDLSECSISIVDLNNLSLNNVDLPPILDLGSNPLGADGLNGSVWPSGSVEVLDLSDVSNGESSIDISFIFMNFSSVVELNLANNGIDDIYAYGYGLNNLSQLTFLDISNQVPPMGINLMDTSSSDDPSLAYSGFVNEQAARNGWVIHTLADNVGCSVAYSGNDEVSE